MHVVYSLGPGGMENGVVNIANGLQGECFQTTIVCIRSTGPFVERLAAGIDVVCLEKSEGFDWSAIKRLRRLIDAQKPDLMHTHNLGALMYASLARGLLRRCPAIVHGEHAELNAGETTFRQRLLRRWFYRQCRALHTVSRGMTRQMENLGLSQRPVTTILNGVDCTRFAPVEPAEKLELRRWHHIAADAQVVVMSGRFGDFKRHDLAIDAFEQLAGSMPELVLLLVGGGGPLERKVKGRQAASRYAGRILCVGFQSDPAPYYRMADLLLITSENEGLSNAMLEAMACGTPCLVRATCGADEVITSGVDGEIAEMTTAEGLARAIRRMLADDSQLMAMGESARQTVTGNFSLSAMIDHYAALYQANRR